MILRAIPHNSRKAGQGWRWWRSASVRLSSSFEESVRVPAIAIQPRGR
jgi:hypothetical protein